MKWMWSVGMFWPSGYPPFAWWNSEWPYHSPPLSMNHSRQLFLDWILWGMDTLTWNSFVGFYFISNPGSMLQGNYIVTMNKRVSCVIWSLHQWASFSIFNLWEYRKKWIKNGCMIIPFGSRLEQTRRMLHGSNCYKCFARAIMANWV